MKKQTYKYFAISKAGGPEILELLEAETPEPKDNEARIRVEAAGVAYPDMLIRISPQDENEYPITLGYDAVGIVDKLGKEVKGLQVGQRVLRTNEEGVGGYAEILCHPADDLVVVPDGVEPADAAAVGLNGVMAYQLVHRMAHVERGEKVLVHVAAGGIGHLLVQLSRLAGATVYGSTSTQKQSVVESMGATPIDYKVEDFETRIQELTEGGVDVIFDSIGGPNLQKSFRSLRNRGRMIMYGAVGTVSKGVLDQAYLEKHRESFPWAARDFVINNKMVGGYAFYNFKQDRPDFVRDDMAAMLQLVADQSIKPIIGRTLPFLEVRHAHEMLDAADFAGKMVLEVS